ncbi:hypothetical protein SteCoe_31632 [Stentor coeruleus]|uniref:Uncharacterized protein n=1 Tax=Stentor coeruleus TaxID=5963 RepID=A0A1R2B0W8_9CILI|nr:hypothetical protein SteCoe_31632 [Stentor coeruleus]
MDNSITYDRFFYQLSQENYEICYGILNDNNSISRIESHILNSVIYIDMLYYTFTQTSIDDEICINLMKELLDELKNSILVSDNPIFFELQSIIEVKINQFMIYKELIGADYSISLDLNRRFETLLRKLSPLQNYELLPYKENLVCQITSLQNLVLAFKSLSTFNYMGTILALTQAHSNIQQWEKVFIHKKYSPMDPNNSKVNNNELHKYLLKVLHCLIAKATLYFQANLSSIHNIEILEFGDEYITSRRVCTKCAELKIHYLALMLDTKDLQAYKNFKEGGYKCLRQPLNVPLPEDKFLSVYENKWRPEELPSATKNALISTLEGEFSDLQLGKPNALSVQENNLDVHFHLAKVDSSVYLVSAHAYAVRRPKNEKNEITEFINSLASQIKVFG